ncbi:hypothetical protein [Carnobacterium maltaromaticum]|uniref:hypothetical protein n=1 Tax=Carnobacterium maltaromaticum TaxID=2751 RepID=UPI00026C8C28|nr:hypothetical protein [Carnobacterium maltaromaticum]
MLNGFCFDSNKVEWFINEKKVEKKLDNIIFCSIDKINNQVFVQTGNDFVTENVYYFDFLGNLSLEFHKKNGKIQWNYNNKMYEENVTNLENVGFYLSKGIILIMYKANENEAFFVDLKNEFLHEVNKPKGFQLAYFEETKNNILIVCNGDAENTDKFGRDQKNFILDISTGELQENGIAY